MLYAAGSPLLTGLRHAACQDPDIVLKLPDKGLSALPQIQIPQIKQINEKLPVNLGGQGVVPLSPPFSQRIQAGDILLPEESLFFVLLIDAAYLGGCSCVHHCEDIELRPCPFQHLRRLQNPQISSLPLRILPAGVVGGQSSVQGQPHQEMIPGQKLTPLLIQAIAIGLEGMGNPHMLPVILLLQLQTSAEKGQPRQRGFPALEGDGALPLRIVQNLPDHTLQGLLLHDSIRTLGALFHLVRIKTVAASHIAQARGRFDHHIYWRHFLPPFQKHIPGLSAVFLHLHPEHGGIFSVQFHKLPVGTLLHNPAFLQHIYPVCQTGG